MKTQCVNAVWITGDHVYLLMMYTFKTLSQYKPLYISRQLHRDVPFAERQVPPFKQGDGRHGTIINE